MLQNRMRKPTAALKTIMAKCFARENTRKKIIQYMMIDSIDIQENDRILEIGTGSGEVFKKITDKLDKGSLKSIEPSKRKVRRATRRNSDDLENGRGEIVYGKPESIPFADRTFNKVFSLHTVQSCTDVKLALKEIYRVLQVDGRFYISISAADKPAAGLDEKKIIQLLSEQYFRDISVTRRDDCLCIIAVK
ncbi:class I SAM-dependent methyltransferase [Bacillus atrophaeus]|uniref:class I SAM-dependent methyltransferase n=1 Tax=Bacillus atrophaeus TaxID=1452 RepID=UPI003CEF4EF0